MAFLPMTVKECEKMGFSQPDFVLVTGDAYVDHPSFGTAVIGRLLAGLGYNVAVLAQPCYMHADDFKRFGKPRFAFLISGGNVDSMVNNYSVFKNRRKRDVYSPGGEAGKRPDRAVITYCNRAKEAYKGVPVVIGGIEASLRRFSHYDYWDDKVRRSILLDSKADLLVYGMGEKSICEIAEALASGIMIKDITWVRGTCFRQNTKMALDFSIEGDTVVLPDFEEVINDKRVYCSSFTKIYENNNHISGKRLLEPYSDGQCVVQNPPMPPLEGVELDDIYELPYERTYAPAYQAAGGVPAIKEVEFSITGSRGCFGGCAFCAIAYHQGREVRGRSKSSIVSEAKSLTAKPGFAGYIHDVGGPTANFRKPACKKQLIDGVCISKGCMYPQICKEVELGHDEYLDILKAVREIDGIKKVFVRSGIRYDYLLADKGDVFLEELCRHHISGTLKVAPEHISEKTLAAMRKPSKAVFEEFSEKYRRVNEKLGRKQYLIPYFISSHPGCSLKDAADLAMYLKGRGFLPDQVQDFYPTPGTVSTCMYYTGFDPFTLEPVYVPKKPEEKKMQRALLHFNKPENRELVKKALKKAGRPELILELLGKRSKNEFALGSTKNNRRG